MPWQKHELTRTKGEPHHPKSVDLFPNPPGVSRANNPLSPRVPSKEQLAEREAAGPGRRCGEGHQDSMTGT